MGFQHDTEEWFKLFFSYTAHLAILHEKELIARTLHQLGPRQMQTFVPVNCASIPEPLFKRESFGHRKGAFTAADQDKPGLFDRAHHGDLVFG